MFPVAERSTCVNIVKKQDLHEKSKISIKSENLSKI